MRQVYPGKRGLSSVFGLRYTERDMTVPLAAEAEEETEETSGDDAARPGKARAELVRLARLSQVAVSGAGVEALLLHYLEEARAATGATRGFAALASSETGGLKLVVTVGEGWTDEAREQRQARLAARTTTEQSGTITVQVATSGQSVRIDDVTAVLNDGYQPFFSDVRSVLAVPIVEPGERVRGVINLESLRTGEFTSDEEAFVRTLADLLALRLAMDDLRARETALVQIGNNLSIAADADTLMKRVADVAAEILRFEDCSIFLLDKATRRAILVATRGLLTPLVGQASYALGEGLTGWVAEHGKAVRLRIPREDPRHKGLYEEFPAHETGAFLAVPIKSTTGVVGVLRVLRRKTTSPWFPNDFTPEDEQVLSTIASQVGAAIDNAQLFARLVQAERMAAWGEMSAVSSHMIGNRVFALSGSLNELDHVLGTDSAPPNAALPIAAREQSVALALEIRLGLRRLEELLAEFRDFVRATALAPVPLDATEMVRQCVDETFPKRGPITLATDYTGDPLPILADPVKLKRALAEIIENAVTFQETGGALRVETRRVGPGESLPPQSSLLRNANATWARITFADRGPGIHAGDKTKIFQPFFTSRNRGMGLGLAIVKGIIEAHKGDIIETGTPGEGARFEVYLPLRAAEEAD